MAADSQGGELPKKRWVEPVAALLMAGATLCTAWCTYESSAWTRQSTRFAGEFNAMERKAALLNVQGMQVATAQASMFMQVIAAQQAGNTALVDTFVQRFPPELRKAYDAWMAQKPYENPAADPHPFVQNLYELRGSREAAEAVSTGAASLEQSRKAGIIASRYLANTVLFAAVLFFAGACGKFEQRRVRLPAFVFAIAVFLFAFVRTVMLPIA